MVVGVGLFTGAHRVCQLSHQLGKPSSLTLHSCRIHHYRRTRFRIAPAAGLDIFSQAWGTNIDIDAQSLAANLFASSIFPYAGFLYHLTRSKKAPGLTLFGFYFLLVFVAATIPAGIYAKVNYKTTLANVDWLHGTAESFLTVTNLLIVLGLRKAIRKAEADSALKARQE